MPCTGKFSTKHVKLLPYKTSFQGLCSFEGLNKRSAVHLAVETLPSLTCAKPIFQVMNDSAYIVHAQL